ncbi:MAG: hypothetical protein Q7K03_10640 [Dehalococcoidia bacterium]|nr:hypothetical protein [Dehalococcoidia bacterium]
MRSWMHILKTLFLIAVSFTMSVYLLVALYDAGWWLWKSHSLTLTDTGEVLKYSLLVVLGWQCLKNTLRS